MAEKTLTRHEHSVGSSEKTSPRRLNPICQTAGTHDQRPEPTDHTTETHQSTQHRAETQSHLSTEHTCNSHGHQRPNQFLNLKNATASICFPAPSGRYENHSAHGTAPKHIAHRTASSSSPMQVNHSVVFTCTGALAVRCRDEAHERTSTVTNTFYVRELASNHRGPEPENSPNLFRPH